MNLQIHRKNVTLVDAKCTISFFLLRNCNYFQQVAVVAKEISDIDYACSSEHLKYVSDDLES